MYICYTIQLKKEKYELIDIAKTIQRNWRPFKPFRPFRPFQLGYRIKKSLYPERDSLELAEYSDLLLVTLLTAEVSLNFLSLLID